MKTFTSSDCNGRLVTRLLDEGLDPSGLGGYTLFEFSRFDREKGCDIIDHEGDLMVYEHHERKGTFVGINLPAREWCWLKPTSDKFYPVFEIVGEFMPLPTGRWGWKESGPVDLGTWYDSDGDCYRDR